MADFLDQDLDGAHFRAVTLRQAEFDTVDLGGARFRDADLTGVSLREADLTGLRVRGSWLRDVDFWGDVENFRINGIDVSAFVESEMDRVYPGHAQTRARTAQQFREAWAMSERLWAETVTRAQELPESVLNDNVDGEWSFIQTLRHLVFATDAWINRALLGEPAPWDRLGLPHEDMPAEFGFPHDADARPGLDEVLALRADRMATVGRVFADLTDEELDTQTTPVVGPGYPEPNSYAVRRCVRAIVNEEWAHRIFAERDLALLRERHGL